MTEKVKKAFIPTLIIVLIVILGIGGYVFISQQTKKKLLEQEGQLKPSAGPVEKQYPESEPREISVPGQPKADKAASLSLRPAYEKASYAVGEVFNLNVEVDGGSEVVDGVEFILNFDPNLVELGQPVDGGFFYLYPKKEADNEKGQVRVAAVQGADENRQLGKAVVVVLPVTTLGQGKVNFSFVKEQSHVAAYGGQDLLDKAIGLEVTIEIAD